jgi:hypothetical protein
VLAVVGLELMPEALPSAPAGCRCPGGVAASGIVIGVDPRDRSVHGRLGVGESRSHH